MRTLLSIVLLIGGAVLLAVGGPPAVTALRARGAAVSMCDDSLRTVPEGKWVRLRGCAVDMFHVGFLDDAGGRRTHRVVPLRPPWGLAAEPSGLALAVPADSSSDAGVFATTARADAEHSKTADLNETTGVVWGALTAVPRRLVTMPGFDSGVRADALVIQVRAQPAVRRSAMLAAAGAASVALGVALFVFRRRTPRASRQEDVEREPVRWGLVLLVAFVGVWALWGTLGWYFNPSRETGEAIQVAAAPPAAPIPGAARSRALPAATPSELALLASSDPVNQFRAAETLLQRAITPDLVTAVEDALRKSPPAHVEARLLCLKSRFTGPGTLDFLIASVPADRKGLGWNQKPELTCIIDALADRIQESPERIRDALLPAVLAANPASRDKVLRAFRTIDVPIPAMVAAEAGTSGTKFQAPALAAAVALGAIGKAPELVAGGLRDPDTRHAVVHDLRVDPHANAARIVGRAWTERPEAGDIGRLAREREMQQHDVSAALLEIVSSPSEPDALRTAAARHLGLLQEVGPLFELRRLSSTLLSGELKAAVDGAVRALEEQQRLGRTPQMHALPR